LRKRNPRLSADRADFVARAWSRSVSDAGSGAGTGGRVVSADDVAVELAFDPRHRMANPVLYRLEEAEACWSQIAAPMLLLIGGASDHRERRERQGGEAQLHTLFRNLRLVTLPGLGHMMHHEDPQAVAEPIIEFERSQA
jgi:pimeloyl-ACP methyl ester carboxylesterase